MKVVAGLRTVHAATPYTQIEVPSEDRLVQARMDAGIFPVHNHGKLLGAGDPWVRQISSASLIDQMVVPKPSFRSEKNDKSLILREDNALASKL